MRCPDCALTVFGKGTRKAHRGSRTCVANQVVAKLHEAGWARAGELASMFRRWPTLHEWHPTTRATRQDVSRGPIKRETEMWVPRWLLDLVLRGSSTRLKISGGGDEVTPDERRRAIRVLAGSAEMRGTVAAEMALAGQDVSGDRVVALLRWVARRARGASGRRGTV